MYTKGRWLKTDGTGYVKLDYTKCLSFKKVKGQWGWHRVDEKENRMENH